MFFKKNKYNEDEDEEFEKYENKELDGYINRIILPNGKIYGLKCAIVEVYPITCPKCGSSFELKYGSGQCPACETYYTTQFKLIEEKM